MAKLDQWVIQDLHHYSAGMCGRESTFNCATLLDRLKLAQDFHDCVGRLEDDAAVALFGDVRDSDYFRSEAQLTAEGERLNAIIAKWGVDHGIDPASGEPPRAVE